MLGHLRAAASVLRRGHTDLETIVDKDNKVAPILCVFLIIFYSDHFGHRVLFNTKSSFQVIQFSLNKFEISDKVSPTKMSQVPSTFNIPYSLKNIPTINKFQYQKLLVARMEKFITSNL